MDNNNTVPVVAIDGPSGGGKSTVARELALSLGFLYIDTGAMYRALTCTALERKVPFEDGPSMEQFLEEHSL